MTQLHRRLLGFVNRADASQAPQSHSPESFLSIPEEFSHRQITAKDREQQRAQGNIPYQNISCTQATAPFSSGSFSRADSAAYPNKTINLPAMKDAIICVNFLRNPRS